MMAQVVPPIASTAPVLQLADLVFGYETGPEIVHGLSLAVYAGQFVGLIGPNGAGKSTLLHLINGLLRPKSGSARIVGEEASTMDPRVRARKVGFVPQSARVLFPYRVGEIVAMGRHPHRAAMAGLSSHDSERIAWAMEMTGVAPFADRPFNQLSGGEAQRVVIARAVAQDAAVLVLDEPTSSLDLYYQSVIYGLLEKLNHEQGMTVLTVTHDLNMAGQYCRRLIGIRDGRVLMDGTPGEIMTTPNIRSLYGVEAEVIVQGEARMAFVRKAEGTGRAASSLLNSERTK